MRLERLVLRDFRNYEQAEVILSPSLNVFNGQNAQGKTNLIEAVYLLAIGRSFRTGDDQELARHGADAFRVAGDFCSADGVKIHVEYNAGGKGRDIRQNGVPLRRAHDLFGQVRVVLFSPDDLQLIKGGPEQRRAYLDLYLAQTNPQHRYALYNLHRLLSQRNEALRRIRDRLAGHEELAVWNETLIKRAVEVAGKRIAALSVLGPLVSGYHQRLSGKREEITLGYNLGGHMAVAPETDLPAYYREELMRREKEEINRGLTLVGPQRDDIQIGFSTGYELRSFGSQGQQRTAALSMKLAAVDFLRARTGENPIVLLDDVLSEFDDTRKRALLDLLIENVQTLITTANRGEFVAVSGCRAFLVERGRVREEMA